MEEVRAGVSSELEAKKMRKTYRKLVKEFTEPKQSVDESKLLKRKSTTRKVLGVITDIVCALVVIFGIVFCFASVNCRMQNVVPSFAGYSTCKIASASMTQSGFDVGDSVIVRAVDTSTLRGSRTGADGSYVWGDIIAFYADNITSAENAVESFTKVAENEYAEKIKYKSSFTNLFGVQNKELVATAKSGSRIFFHHIVDVYMDAQGVRWFKTQGSSNALPDQTTIDNADGSKAYLNCGYVNENMVVGAYDDSSSARAVSWVLGAISSDTSTILVVLLPLLLLAIILIMECLSDVRLAVVECEVVDGTRKVFDPVCVKNQVGYNLSKEDKLKVLSRTPIDEINDTIACMWKDGSCPTAIRKYYLRKKVYLRPIAEKQKLYDECKKMYDDGVDEEQISKYYLEGIEKVKESETRIAERLKSVKRSGQFKTNKQNNKENKQEDNKQNCNE